MPLFLRLQANTVTQGWRRIKAGYREDADGRLTMRRWAENGRHDDLGY